MVQFARTKRSEGNFLPLYHGDPVNSYLHQTLQFWCFLPFLLVPKGVFSNGARWGFACCHQTMKNSYCVPIQKRELEVGEGWAQKSKSLPPFSQEFWLLRTSRIFGRFLVVWGCLRVYIYIYINLCICHDYCGRGGGRQSNLWAWKWFCPFLPVVTIEFDWMRLSTWPLKGQEKGRSETCFHNIWNQRNGL